MAVTIVRDADIDDDGSGTTGTIHNNAWKSQIYDRIDTALAAVGAAAQPLVSASGQIAFPATQNPSAGANTLDDYEEGSWTPANPNITFTTAVGRYIKIGRLVIAAFSIVFPATADGNSAQMTGLPFASHNVAALGGSSITYTTYATPVTILPNQNTTAAFFLTLGGVNITNATLTGKAFDGCFVYLTTN